MKKKYDSNLWVEKFRPDSIKTAILPRKYRTFFNGLIKSGELNNLILYSKSPGSGKTVTAKALCNDINADMLYKNMSKDTGIDVLRDEISKFARTKSFGGNKKVVVLDEVCQSTINFQKGLKAFIEQYTNSCRFILTCNTLTKVIPELQSRCQVLHYDWSGEQIEKEIKPAVKKRLISILKKNEIEFDGSVIDKLINKFYPDIRKMFNVCQQYSEMNGKIDGDILAFKEIGDELIEFILNKKFTSARKYIIENNIQSEDFFKFCYERIVPQLDKSKKSRAIVMINEYQVSDYMAAIKEINVAAFLIEFISECIV